MSDKEVYLNCVGCSSTEVYAASIRYCKKCHYEICARSKKKWVEKCKQFVRDYKEALGCMDCKRRYLYYQLDLDHVRGEKVRDVSQMFGQYGKPKIQQELEKCDVVCANCHRTRTYKRSKDIFVNA